MFDPTIRVPAAAPVEQAQPVLWRWDHVAIDGLAAELPSEVLTTAQLEDQIRPLYRRLGFKPGWVETVTGIHQRRVWGPGDSALDGVVRASRKALAEAGRHASEVGLLISCSVYKPRLEPSLACEIGAALGVVPGCINFDIANACLGVITGMALAADLISLGRVHTALIVSGEDATPVLDATVATLSAASADIHAFKANLATLTLGSAASAVLLTRSDRARHAHRLVGGTTLTAPELHGLCRGGADGMETDSVALLREGVAIAKRTSGVYQAAVGAELANNGIAALHQVGRAHHDTVVRTLGLDTARSPQIYPELGNIGSCGVPVTAALARDEGRIAPGSGLSLMGIGSGLNCAMLGVRW